MSEDRVSSISRSRSWEEMGEFWDTHSLADYDDQTYEVEMIFEPSARRATRCSAHSSLVETLRGAEDEGQPGSHADHVPVVERGERQTVAALV